MSVGVIDPASREIVADIPVGFESSLIAAGEGFVWVLDPKARTLTTIDPKTREVVQPTRGIPADGIPIGLAVGEGSVWVAVNQGDRLAVLEIGPELGELRGTVTLHTSEFGSLSVLRESVVLTIGDRALWALERGRGEVTRIDPETRCDEATRRRPRRLVLDRRRRRARSGSGASTAWSSSIPLPAASSATCS